MMKSCLIVVTLLSLSQFTLGCSARLTDQETYDAAALGAISIKPVGQPVHVVGTPYFRNGRWYRPRHQPDYAVTGPATWYGRAHTGRITANGEASDAQNLFAAHPTLPLPSYAEVTNLRNGRVLTVRINDRQPLDGREIIALSRRAAEILKFNVDGTTQVHVRYLSPAPIEYIGRNK